jgi:hypothetical protein
MSYQLATTWDSDTGERGLRLRKGRQPLDCAVTWPEAATPLEIADALERLARQIRALPEQA